MTFCGALAGTGLICAPSFKFAVPWVITFSPAARPCGHDPVGALSALGDDRPLHRPIARPDDEQVALPCGSRVTACCGTRKADVSIACANCAVTNMPGKQNRLRIGKARAQRDGAGALVDHDLAELDRPGVDRNRYRREA